MKYTSYTIDGEGKKMNRRARKAARKETYAHNRSLHTGRAKQLAKEAAAKAREAALATPETTPA